MRGGNGFTMAGDGRLEQRLRPMAAVVATGGCGCWGVLFCAIVTQITPNFIWTCSIYKVWIWMHVCQVTVKHACMTSGDEECMCDNWRRRMHVLQVAIESCTRDKWQRRMHVLQMAIELCMHDKWQIRLACWLSTGSCTGLSFSTRNKFII